MHPLIGSATSVLEQNWRDGFTIPCQGLYPFQWHWDSGFIALGWAHVNRENAFNEIRSLLKGQWKNGFIPHIVFHNESDSYYPGPEVHAAWLNPDSPQIKTSGITQPPVLGFVVEDICEIANYDEQSIAFAEEVFDKVFLNIEYYFKFRDPKDEGLVYICHNWEAGTDNTPVWDFIWQTFEIPEYDIRRKDTEHIDASHRPTNKEYQYYIHLIELFKSLKYNDSEIAKHSPFLIQDPLFNSMLLGSAEALSRLAERLGKQEKKEVLRKWYEQGKDRFNEKLYDHESASYIYYDLRNERKLSHISSSSFAPLFAGIPSGEIAEKLVKHLEGGRFSGRGFENYLCASFDPESPYFNSKKYWRGPIWINLNWIIYKGLLRYGFSELAKRVKQDTLELIERFGFYEYFEPSKTINRSLQTGYGGKNFSWSAALVIDIINSEKDS